MPLEKNIYYYRKNQFTTNSTGWDGLSLRYKIPASHIKNSCDKIIIKFSNYATYSFNTVYIGHKADSGGEFDFDGNQVKVTFNGSEVSVNGDDCFSDIIDFNLKYNKDLIISADCKSGITTSIPITDITEDYELAYSASNPTASDSVFVAYTISPSNLKQHLVDAILGVKFVEKDLSDGLIAVYNFDNNCLDSYGSNDGNPNNITYIEDPVVPTAVFNGSSSNINIGSLGLIQGSIYTVSLWFKANSFSLNNSSSLIYGGSGTDQDGIMLSSSDYSTINPQISLGSSCTNISTYINGNEVALPYTNFLIGDLIHLVSTFTVDSIDGGDHYIGSADNSSNWFDGSIGKILIYKRQLSEEEVKSLYNEYSYPSTIQESLKSNLVAAYSFDGHVKDLHRDNHGTPTDITYIDGKLGQAASFNGTSSVVAVKLDNIPKANDEKTVSFWIKPNGTSSYYGIISTRDTANNLGRGFIFQIVTNEIVFGFTGVPGVNYSYNFLTDTWYHCLVTTGLNGNDTKIYLDGELVKEGSIQSPAYDEILPSDLLIGSQSGAFSGGLIDQVLIYNKALSQTEVSVIYNSGLGYEYPFKSGWLEGYKYRKKIKIDNTLIDEDITHFPIPITINQAAGKTSKDLSHIFDIVGPDYSKIAVTKEDGTTQLYYEVEQWDETNKKALIWTSREGFNISSTLPTYLYLYYDANVISNTSYVGTPGNRPEVWNSNFVARYGMSQDPSELSLLDSTNTYDGFIYGGMSSDNVTETDTNDVGLQFDGVDDYIIINDGIDLGSSEYTIDIHFRMDNLSSSQYPTILNLGGWVGFSAHTSSDGTLYIGTDATYRITTISNYLSNGNTYHLSVTKNSTDLKLYNNGIEDYTKSNTATPVWGGTSTIISEASPASCTIYEIRVLNTTTSDWHIKLNSYAQNDNLLEHIEQESIPEWLSGWKYRVKINIDNVKISEDLTHFPVPIILNSAAGIYSKDTTAIFNEIGDNYLKIAVTKEDQETQLYVEIEQWDSINQKATLWVSKDDFTIYKDKYNYIYLYYDSSQADNISYVGLPGGRPEVWNSNFVARYGMSQDPFSSDIIDSTYNSNYGSSENHNQSALVDGKIGDGIMFYNDGGKITLNASIYSNYGLNNKGTIYLWAKREYAESNTGFITLDYGTNRLMWLGTGAYNDLNFWSAYTASSYSSDDGVFGDWAFHRVCVKYESENIISFYVDGNNINSISMNTLPSTATSIQIGKLGESHYTFNGIIDDVVIKNDVDDDLYIKLDYYAQSDTFVDLNLQAEWFSNWGNRRKIIIDNTNIEEDLIHFPLAIIINNSTGQQGQDLTDIFDEIGDSYKKIAVVKDNNIDQLYVEVEQWDSINRKAVLWVSKEDFIISSDEPTILYLYFDITKDDNINYVGDPGSRQEVWLTNIKSVYNMVLNDTNTAIIDSTSNSIGYIYNITIDDGLINKAAYFNGTNGYIDIGTTIENTSRQYSFCAVVKPASRNDEDFIVTFGDTALDVARSMLLYKNDGQFHGFASDGSNHLASYSTSIYNVNEWYNVVFSRDNEEVSLYVDGIKLDAVINTSTGDSIRNSGYIGRNEQGDGWFDGLIDSVVIWSNACPSDSWVKTDYNNQTNNLLYFNTTESRDFGYNFYGTTSVNNTTTSGVPILMFKRDTYELVETVYSDASGNFNIHTPYFDDHFIVALPTISGANALIYDWMHPKDL